MKRYLTVSITLLLTVMTLSGQSPIRYSVVPAVPADTSDLAYYGKERHFRALGSIAGLNVGVWAYGRYIRKGDYAYISGSTMMENFRTGFIWDNDNMGNNMFLHPYHGSLYHNASRSNGFNYWQSGALAFGGSAMWEFLMECEYPSTNDIIATPVGGMALGEVFYRASDIVLDDRTSGWERFGREAAAMVISPMRGLTRILTGDAWLRRATSGRQFGIPDVSVEFSVGVRTLEFKDEMFDSGMGLSTEIAIEYGDRYSTRNRLPYDYFTLRTDINLQASQPVLGRLNIMGRLLGRDIYDRGAHCFNIGMYQHFDYYDSDTISDLSAKTPYKICSPATLGCGLMYRRLGKSVCNFDAFLHANGIILGGVLSDYYHVDQRNYNLSSGFGLKSGLNFTTVNQRLSVSLTHEYYQLYTWKGYPLDMDWEDYDERTLDVQGDKSSARLNVSELRIDYRLWKKLYLTGVFTQYSRETRYKYLPNVTSNSTESRIVLTYKL